VTATDWLKSGWSAQALPLLIVIVTLSLQNYKNVRLADIMQYYEHFWPFGPVKYYSAMP